MVVRSGHSSLLSEQREHDACDCISSTNTYEGQFWSVRNPLWLPVARRVPRLGGEQPGEFSNTRQDVVRLLLPHDCVGTGPGEYTDSEYAGRFASLNING